MIKLHFPKLACFPRTLEPATVSVPFPKGELFDLTRCQIVDRDGNSFPGQFRATTLWPDGSVKWLLVHLQVDLPGNESTDYYLNIDSVQKQCSNRLKVSGNLIDTGVLCVGLSETQDAIFDFIDTPQGRFAKEEITPFMIKDACGNKYVAGAGKNGWEVIEAGPVRAMLRTRGRHHSEKGSYFDYKITLYAYAGKPWIDLEYCVTNTESGKLLVLPKASKELTVSSIRSMTMNVNPASEGEVKTYVAQAAVRTSYLEGETSLLVDEKLLQYAMNEQSPEVLYGTLYGDWQDDKRGVAVTIYQAQQNLPKRIAVCKEGLTIDLIPEESGAVEFIEGVAKTHRIQLLFHSASADREKDITFRSFQYQLPDKPVIDPEVYERSGTFEDIFTTKRNYQVEHYFERLFMSRSNAFGILHWGDNVDAGYTHQGRGNGEDVWVNGEYDAGHAFYLYYITHKSRLAYGAMKCTTEHIMDVDICHHSSDPARYGGQIPHSARHVTKACVPSHEWVEGLIDYYHETGDPDVLEIAVNVGKNIMYALENVIFSQSQASHSAREAGWALFSFVALYLETHDEVWLNYCDRITYSFYEWEKREGSFITLYTNHSTVRTPYMTSVAINALKSFYNVRPSEELKGLILRAAEDMVNHCISEYTGLFFYKELPSVNHSEVIATTLGALTYVYHLSNDIRFLKFGIPTFEAILRTTPSKQRGIRLGYHCMIKFDGSPSNKGFAQSISNLLLFYKAVMDNKLFPESTNIN